MAAPPERFVPLCWWTTTAEVIGVVAWVQEHDWAAYIGAASLWAGAEGAAASIARRGCKLHETEARFFAGRLPQGALSDLPYRR